VDHLTPELLRMFERELIVVGGILAIYLGYRLFYLAHIPQESSGKIKTKLFEFAAAKVGPGVFFAAFGAWVLYTGMTTRIDITTTTQPQTPARTTQTQFDPQALVRLNTLLQKLPAEEDRQAAASLLRQIIVAPAQAVVPAHAIAPAQTTTTKRSYID
jgi:hypothetical protein